MLPPRPQHQSKPERRGSYRCPIVGERTQGNLRIGKDTLEVQVLDESVGGFGIALESAPGCEVGAKLLFEIASSWIEVQVVSIEPIEPAADVPPEQAGKQPIRIGLLRLRDIEPWELETTKSGRLSWRDLKSLLMPLAPLKSTFRGTTVMILAVIAAGAVLIWVLEGSAPMMQAMRDELHRSAAAQKAHDPLASAAAHDPDEAKPAKDVRPPKEPPEPETPSPATDETKSEPTAAAPGHLSIPENVLRLAHPAFVLKPEVTKLLSLSQEQHQALRQLFKDFRNGALAVPEGAEASGDHLVALGRRVVEILNAEQRHALAEMLARPETAEEAAKFGAAPSLPEPETTTSEATTETSVVPEPQAGE